MKNQKGITLIALVVTILVLLILAAVSITAITNEDKGVVSKAKEATAKAENEKNKEEDELSDVIDYTDIKLDDSDEKVEASSGKNNSAKVATFTDGTTLTWDELKLEENGSKYHYKASAISDTEIGDEAFRDCMDLVSINIPEGVVTIGNSSFMMCVNLEEIYLPDTLKVIGSSTFHITGFTEIELPEGLTTIGNYAFFDTCPAYFYIPSSVTTIGYGAFYHFEEIVVDNDNQNYSSEDGFLYNKDKTTLIKAPYSASIDRYVMPDSVTTIESMAFSANSGAKTIVLNNKVTVDGFTFDEAYGLEAIELKAGNTKYSVEDGVLYNKDKTTLIRYPYSKEESTFTVPSSVTEIGTGAFYQNIYPQNLIIESFVTAGDAAFGESPFVTISLPEEITPEVIYNLAGSSVLEAIEYAGTMEQWDSLGLEEDWWEYMAVAFVNCSDGTIEIERDWDW